MSEETVFNKQVRVLGLGGAGSLIVDLWAKQATSSADCLALDSDAKFLESINSAKPLLVGKEICRGIGCGGDFDLAVRAIEEDRDALYRQLEDAHVIILVAGLGGGVGSALSAMLAELSGKTDALILGFFILPFSFEGSRFGISESTAGKIRPLAHGMFTIQNDLLLQEGDTNQSALSVFESGNRWILNSLNALQDVLFENGLLNQDLGALKKIFSQRGGKSFFAVSGQKNDVTNETNSMHGFVSDFLSGPFFHLDVRPKHLDKLLIVIKGSRNLELSLINEISSLIIKELNFKKDVNLGAFIDPSLINTLEVSIFGKAELQEKPLPTSNAPGIIATDERESDDTLLNMGLVDDAPRRKVHKSKLGKKQDEDLEAQKEFQFFDNGENRGYFENTESGLYNGINLDIPTYLRKGIKVKYK